MGDGQEPRRRLQLNRETLRNLEPTAAEAEGVRGAQKIPSLGGEGQTCNSVCNCGVIGWVAGQTHMSWGCIMDIVIDRSDPHVERIRIEGHPSPEFEKFIESHMPRIDKPQAGEPRGGMPE